MTKKFRDRLTEIGLGIIGSLWVIDGLHIIDLRPEIIGATIVTWALIFNFYFRKKPKEEQV